MTGMNASINAGWYTFSNLGPITTTFTAAPSCTSQTVVGYMNPTGGNAVLKFATKCTDEYIPWSECVPPTTSAPTTATPTFTGTTQEEYEEYLESQISWRGWGEYYSPGLYCPSGWETVGMAARDNKGSLTSSGALVPTTTTATRFKTGDHWYYPDQPAASVIKEILEPKQTMALCCPRSMTADSFNLCYSIVEDYRPTFGCEVYTGYNYEYGETVATYIDLTDGVTRTATYDVPTATLYTTETYKTTIDPEDTYYSGIVYAPVVTLLHHESDFSSGAAASSASGTASPATGDSNSNNATPSNAAGRLSPGTPVWDGIRVVIGIPVTAMVLGATMILPW